MRIGRWSINHPRAALATWLAFVACCVALGAVTGTKTLDNGAIGESARGYAIMDHYQLWPPPRELAYIHNTHGLLSAAVVGDVARRFSRLGLAPQRTVSPDGRSAVIAATVESASDATRIRSA